MQQFMDIKNKYKDCIIFFRMGDFYETFFDDAKITAKTLDITLTKRGIKNSDKSIPLAGIPYHALDSYLNKMIKNGFKVAIVEQLEDPKFAKGIVKRDVVRIVTPGTVIDEKMLSKNNNFIASLSVGEKCGLAFVDISTGEFLTTEVNNIDEGINELSKYYPNELVTYEGTLSINEPGVTSIPNKFSLRQNYPNPFNPVTAIDYELNVMGDVKLVIYNMLGQEVKTLINRSNISAGSYSVNWDGIDNMGQKVSDGVYLYKLQVGENLITKKMVLLK